MAKSKEPVEYNVHHVIPRSRGGVDYEINLMRMNAKKHKHIHGLFGNKVFHEKVQLLTELDEQVLTKGIRAIIQEIIMLPPKDMYKEECFRTKEMLEKIKLKGF